MSTDLLSWTPELRSYLTSVSLREHPALERLRLETETHPCGIMQIAPEQGQFMALLVKLMNVRLALEVGVFTGYSSTVVALALPSGGQLIALDNNEVYARRARETWREAGVEDRITLRIGDAIEGLDRLLSDGAEGSFDFVFLDADKKQVSSYYERCLQLMRTGGLVAVDNTLLFGRVADLEVQDPETKAIRAFNRMLHADERIDIALLPVADGLTLALKR